MRQALTELVFSTAGPGLSETTREVASWIDEVGIRTGLLATHCKHTSASLLITGNASSAVWRDLAAWLDRIAPQSGIYDHDTEGPDDMPAHLKNALLGVNLSLPVA